MSLKTKLTVVLTLNLITIFVVNMLVQRFSVFPSFVELEKQGAINNINRVEQAIHNEITHLNRYCADWSVWDDTYQFVQDTNSTYIESNLTVNTFIDSKLNVFIAIDSSNGIVYQRFYDVASGWEISFPAKEIEVLKDFSNLREGDNLPIQDNIVSGLVATSHGPLLFSSRPILTSEGTGPSQGYLIMGRFLNEQLQESLKKQTKVDFQFTTLDSHDKLSGKKVRNKTYIELESSKSILVQREMESLSKSDHFKLSIHYPREISLMGKSTIFTGLILFIIPTIIVIFIIYTSLQKSFVLPLKRITEIASRIRTEENYSFRMPDMIQNEIGILSTEFNLLVGKVEKQTVALREANTDLKQLARVDGLTGLYNRRTLDEVIKYEWRRHTRTNKLISIILCDIDNFKKYNDHFGHQQGDEAIQAVSSVLQRCIYRPADAVFRYGGEEFLIILAESSIHGAETVAERIRSSVENLTISHVPTVDAEHVTVSLGISCGIPSEEYSYDKAIKIADEALYEAKDAGRNCYIRNDHLSID